jgi:hypothetical protein
MRIRIKGVEFPGSACGEEQGFLVARVILTDPKGNPTCASVGAPFIEWSAAAS